MEKTRTEVHVRGSLQAHNSRVPIPHKGTNVELSRGSVGTVGTAASSDAEMVAMMVVSADDKNGLHVQSTVDRNYINLADARQAAVEAERKLQAAREAEQIIRQAEQARETARLGRSRR